ncbi:hypothetical protein BAE44_0012632 [Dichanthelium oligosanthes]|uniref:F-box domain-containing protein n=1 Tax=Dichanthelium oligosanthes TaxID=888268 RepID=A0A1E5VMI8_9POAL|nr:hypothetical protein BAE44_0012632 [Dichanthelium oligosanthes]
MPSAAIVRPRKRPRLGEYPTPWPSSSSPLAPLPLDLLLEIAGLTDPATLVRCAATCKDLHRRIGDTSFRHRLRHGNRFVRSLLRGHLVQERDKAKHVALNAAWCSPTALADEDKPFTLHGRPVAAYDGLVLARVTEQPDVEVELLRVYNSATGRYQTLPPGPKFSGQDILLVGDGEGGGVVGRSFKVLNVKLVVLTNHHRCLKIQTFSSEHGAWGPFTKIPIPLRHQSNLMRLLGNHRPLTLLGKPLVFGDAVHLLCWTYYILTLHDVGAAPRVTWTELPSSFPCCQPDQVLLATSTAGSSPIVLVADINKICAWSRSQCTGKWKKRPQVVIRNQAIIDTSQRMLENVQLKWFGERSGVVLIHMPDRGDFCWLDLRTKEIIRSSAGRTPDIEYYFPYEMNLSAWVPTFGKTF